MELLSSVEEDRDSRLTRQDWVLTALNVFLQEGIGSVQITKLAEDLGVTRGSFYWHFKSRKQLLDAIVAEWRIRNTDIMVQALSRARTVEQGILELFYIWVDHSKFSPQLDQAMRDWGRISPEISTLVQSEDDSRVAAIAAFFRDQNYEETEAFIRARVTYFTQLSYYALGVEESTEQRMAYLETYVDCFTGQKISDVAADEFRRRMISGQASR